MSRASLVRYSCPWRVKPIFPMIHRPCLISSWVTSTAVSGNQRPTGCGPGSAKRSPRIVRGRPPAISIALRQSQMDIFDFHLALLGAEASELFHETDSTAGRDPGATSLYLFPLSPLPGGFRIGPRRQGSAAPWTAPGRSEGDGCLRGERGVQISSDHVMSFDIFV